MILGFGAFEKVKPYEPRHLVELTVARKPDLLGRRLGLGVKVNA